VEQIAQETRLSEAQASLALRALQSRGLIAAARKSRWVRYVPETDPLVPSAQPILDAFCEGIRIRGTTDAELFRTLTAFTHPRRLALLRCLQARGPLLFETLAALCRISPPAAYRHLRKLAARDLVTLRDGSVTLTPVKDPLTCVLLDLISSGT
jgi:DNA-binding transcriptional ArsR family regulator